MRWGGKMNNNMNFNWEKKISLKEIAQFYEDKLRELDSKQNSIISNLVKENEELTNTIKRLEANIQPISNILSGYKDMESHIFALIKNEINENDSKFLDEFKKEVLDTIRKELAETKNSLSETDKFIAQKMGEYRQGALDHSMYINLSLAMILFSFLHINLPQQYSSMEPLIKMSTRMLSENTKLKRVTDLQEMRVATERNFVDVFEEAKKTYFIPHSEVEK